MNSFVGGLLLLNGLLHRATAQYFQSGETNDCNQDLMNRRCESWAEQDFNLDEEVIIPCGQCVEVTEDLTVTLRKGMNVIGRLRIAPPQGTKVEFTTNHVVVQGVLSIDTPYAPGTDETVHFIMTNDDGQDHYFTPYGVNSAMCGGSCIAGKRAILVGGGRLDVNGLPADCTTWTQLESVSTLPAPDVPYHDSFVPATGSCGTTVINVNFNSVAHWYGRGGALFYVRKASKRGNYFEVTNRHLTSQGPTMNLPKEITDCIVPNVVYRYSLYIKLHSEKGSPSNCVTNGENCPYVYMNRRECADSSCENIHRGFGRTNRGYIRKDDTWFPVSGTVVFSEDDLVDGQYYKYISIDGPEAKIDIAIDNFQLTRLTEAFFPSQNVCNDLIINGDAQMDGINPYPFYSTDGGAALVVQKQRANRFFRLYGRKHTWSTIRYKVPFESECLAPEMVYRFSFRSRAKKAHKIYSRFGFMTKDTDGSDEWNQIKIADCTTGSRWKWKHCSGRVGLSKPEIFDAHEIYLDIVFTKDKRSTVDFDDFAFTFESGPAGGFLVPAAGVENCWTPGSKVLITSDTMYFEDDTIVTIKSVTSEGGKAALSFEENLAPRASKEEMFAVELALLERNIKFEPDTDELGEGGHLAVWQTPQSQVLDGAEFYKFGQQGTLGRYPIHWHMCGEVEDGTIVKRNLVRDSNQRCVVIHGSHNVTIEENVGYENFGHCYLLEDGGEINNVFTRNFGSRTKDMEIDPPLRGGIDDDDQSSTFWCTNPMNTWNGNIAAGGENTGFWFELESAVKSPSQPVVEGRPFELALKKFVNNTAHSYRRIGMKTYTHGYRPHVMAVFENLWSYKNHGDGVFFHNSWNLGIKGGVFADNRQQIRIHRADNVKVEDALVLGQTDSHRLAMDRTGRNDHCPSSHASLYGITIHSFLFSDSSPRGPTLKNITFSNITDASGCDDTAAIFVHDDEVEPSFDSWTKFSELSFESNIETRFSMCKAIAKGVTNVVIEVADDSVYGSAGFLISDGQPELVRFVDETDCDLDTEACLQFCEGVCLQTISFLVPATPETEGMVLEIESVTNQKKQTYHDGGLTRSDNLHYEAHQSYTLALPQDEYKMRFTIDGEEVFPAYVIEKHQDTPECMGAGSVTISRSESTPPSGLCTPIVSGEVRNGDVETGTLEFWKHIWSEFDILAGGYQSSYGVQLKSKNSMRVGQDLNTHCLNAGDEFEITARIRFDDGNGNVVACDPNSNSNGERCSYATIVAEHVENGEIKKKYERAAIVIDSTSTDEWRLLHGVYRVSDIVGRARRAFLYLEYATQYAQVDDLVVHRLDRNGAIIMNHDFETGDHRFWPRGYHDGLTMVSPGFDNSIAAVKTFPGRSIVQYISSSNLVAGARYKFEAQFQLEGGDNDCDTSLWDEPTSCPRVVFYSTFDDGSTASEWKGFLWTAAPYRPNQWNTLYGYTMVSQTMASADRVRLAIEGGPTDASIILDDITFEKVESQCNDLVVNGGAEPGDARGWVRRGDARLSVTADGSTGYALVASNRNHTWSGFEQDLDGNCMIEGEEYVVTGKMKMVNEQTGEPHGCVSGVHWGSNPCPTVGILTRFEAEKRNEYVAFPSTVMTEWVADGWNDYRAEFAIPPELTGGDFSKLYIDRSPIGIAIYVDELTITIKPNIFQRNDRLLHGNKM